MMMKNVFMAFASASYRGMNVFTNGSRSQPTPSMRHAKSFLLLYYTHLVTVNTFPLFVLAAALLALPSSAHAEIKLKQFLEVSCRDQIGKNPKMICFFRDYSKGRAAIYHGHFFEVQRVIWHHDTMAFRAVVTLYDGKGYSIDRIFPSRLAVPRNYHNLLIDPEGGGYLVPLGDLVEFDWDTETNLPSATPASLPERYFQFIPLLFSRTAPDSLYVFLLGTGMYLLVYARGRSLAADQTPSAGVFVHTILPTITLLILYFVLRGVGDALTEQLERYPKLIEHVTRRHGPGGTVLPLKQIPGIEYSGVTLFFGIPAFLALHLLFVWFGIVRLSYFLGGLHYLFVPHPAKHTIDRATGRTNSPLDASRLAKDLTPSSTSSEDPPPTLVSENMARKAEKLREKAQAQRKRYEEETRLAEEAIEMERTRNRRNDAQKR